MYTLFHKEKEKEKQKQKEKVREKEMRADFVGSAGRLRRQCRFAASPPLFRYFSFSEKGCDYVVLHSVGRELLVKGGDANDKAG